LDLQIEFVKDKTTKEPFDPATRLSFRMQEKALCSQYALSLYGSLGTVDGVRGDHVLLSPPFTVSKEEIDLIVDGAAKVLTEVLHELGL
jgi:adenosylmethionine-8-amino-7-oxononanoate aminotransferase